MAVYVLCMSQYSMTHIFFLPLSPKNGLGIHKILCDEIIIINLTLKLKLSKLVSLAGEPYASVAENWPTS